jgi:hypothetical protein
MLQFRLCLGFLSCFLFKILYPVSFAFTLLCLCCVVHWHIGSFTIILVFLFLFYNLCSELEAWTCTSKDMEEGFWVLIVNMFWRCECNLHIIAVASATKVTWRHMMCTEGLSAHDALQEKQRLGYILQFSPSMCPLSLIKEIKKGCFFDGCLLVCCTVQSDRGYRRFRGAYWLRHYGSFIMDIVTIPETYASFYQKTRCNISEDSFFIFVDVRIWNVTR